MTDNTSSMLSSRRFPVADDAAAYALALQNGWTDGLPIVTPTPVRVSAFIAAFGRAPDELIAQIAPAMGRATIEKIAVNAVMAGCRPDYAPIVIGAIEALADPAFNLPAIQTTTNSVAPLTIVNGPIRDAVGMNSGRGLLGPGNHANATIGRAIRLVLLNVGGAHPGSTDRSCTGWPAKYGFSFAEDEESNPWGPLHASRSDLEPGESAVTVVAAQGSLTILAITDSIETVIDLMANALSYDGCKTLQEGGGSPLFVIPPDHARALHAAGYSRADLQRAVYERGSRAIEEIRYKSPVNHWNAEDGVVRPCGSSDDILFVVGGGAEPYHLVFIPNFGESEAITRRI
jgi:hypothetical protein